MLPILWIMNARSLIKLIKILQKIQVAKESKEFFNKSPTKNFLSQINRFKDPAVEEKRIQSSAIKIVRFVRESFILDITIENIGYMSVKKFCIW